MKFLKILLVITCLVLSTKASAILNNYSTDAKGQQWLHLSVTEGQSYSKVEAQNRGWCHASNLQVEALFSEMFSGYVDSLTVSRISRSDDGMAYVDQYSQAVSFSNFFGITKDAGDAFRVSYGLYLDEDQIFRSLGVWYSALDQSSIVYSDEWIHDYTNCLTGLCGGLGFFMVRCPL